MKLLLAILLTFNCLAQEIKYIEKGQPAPFTGYVITIDMEKQMRKDKQTLEAKNVVLSDLNVLKDKRITFHQEEAENAYKELRKQRVKTTLYTIGGFTVALGLSAITILALKGAIK